eukprot:gnl/TRDRNA2_/TRDRNA2_74471_c0_seq1.p2 gnl/TRDRNA2_/TRDRNA2_74471_c0~~gnl/TRDRNA2_/TRDRNA2_74471_c0_seq1.p2  ORF type:complete len:103 (+),score=0.50 gnl/TRDRNA2_/TRDRNA2_74471_c0_seq1:85-393(+)
MSPLGFLGLSSLEICSSSAEARGVLLRNCHVVAFLFHSTLCMFLLLDVFDCAQDATSSQEHGHTHTALVCFCFPILRFHWSALTQCLCKAPVDQSTRNRTVQ